MSVPLKKASVKASNQQLQQDCGGRGFRREQKWTYLVVLQRVLHGERLDELLRTDETQPVLEVKHVRYRRKLSGLRRNVQNVPM